MRILYLAHRIPFPPNKGDKLRAFRHIEHLAREHEVWCACFVDDPNDMKYVEPLSKYCRRVAAISLNRRCAVLRGLWGLATGSTVTESFYADRRMQQALDVWCHRVAFDVVLAFSSSMAPYGLRVPASRRVLDLCDVDSRKWLEYGRISAAPLRWFYSLEGRRLAERERAWGEAFDATLVVTRQEAELLPLRSSNSPGLTAERIHVVGNGVVLPRLDTLADVHRSEIPTVGFVGALNYRPNVDAVCWFVEECWPGIIKSVPESVFKIIGHSPVRRIRALGRRPGVEVVGSVEDVLAEIRRFDVSVAPLRLVFGIPNKVLESLAAACPVVTTSEVANRLGLRDAEHCYIADTPGTFKVRVVQLLREGPTRRQLGLAGRALVSRDFRWEDQLGRLDSVLAVSKPRSPLDSGVSRDWSSSDIGGSSISMKEAREQIVEHVTC